jgi:hypothetical protein
VVLCLFLHRQEKNLTICPFLCNFFESQAPPLPRYPSIRRPFAKCPLSLRRRKCSRLDARWSGFFPIRQSIPMKSVQSPRDCFLFIWSFTARLMLTNRCLSSRPQVRRKPPPPGADSLQELARDAGKCPSIASNNATQGSPEQGPDGTADPRVRANHDQRSDQLTNFLQASLRLGPYSGVVAPGRHAGPRHRLKDTETFLEDWQKNWRKLSLQQETCDGTQT